MKAHLVILIIHIICGFTALTVGIVPMVAKKGGKLHRTAGKIYAWGMYGVSATTLGLFLLNPGKPLFQFLLCIALLGFYLTFSGVRSITLHRKHQNSRTADRLVAWVTLVVSVLMFLYGGYLIFIAQIHHTTAFLGILYFVFGPALGSAAHADVKDFTSNVPQEKMRWFFNHFIRMLSAYIATFTAFCVVNVHFLPPLMVWIFPGVIGGTIITLLVKKYNRKFNEGVGKSGSPEVGKSELV
jgi:uncharacterized membrane protein